MSFLVALAAFVAIVSVYATVVTVLVEALHKLLGLRSSGLNEMLRAFYDTTLVNLQHPNSSERHKVRADTRTSGPSKGAKIFADTIASAKSTQSPKFWSARRWPLIGRFFVEKRRSMTTLEFIESLAETPEGAALRHYSRADMRKALSLAAYQFERLGERHNVYFRSRANMLSVLVGIAVAAFANFDALTVYRVLKADSELSSRLTLALDHERLEALRQLAETGSDEDKPLSPYTFTEDWAAQASQISSLGIPVGRKMFPYCEGYKFDSVPLRNTNAKDVAPARGDGLRDNVPYYDVRCAKERQQRLNSVWLRSFTKFREDKRADREKVSSVLVLDWIEYRLGRIAVIGHNIETFVFWLLGVLVAGGLLGLGAPFWFKVFSRLSATAAPAARATLATAKVSETLPNSSDPDPIHLVRGETPERTNDVIDQLEKGFVTVLTSQSQGVVSSLVAVNRLGSLEEAKPGKQIGTPPGPGPAKGGML